MKRINIYQPTEGTGLEVHTDTRGTIADVFYNTNIHHVCVLKNNPGAIRGNHYHKQTTQHTLLTKGKMRYWSQDAEQTTPATFVDMEIGDLVSSAPNEIHTLEFLDEESECVVFTEGPRGGADYENDTFRVDCIVAKSKA
jgi:hypothetical protein